MSFTSISSGERRRGSRLRLRFPIHFSRRDRRTVSAETDDLSVHGFYCTSAEPFFPGERLQCEILIPEGARGADGEALTLQCQVQVVRVEVRGLEPGFGVACKIEDRRLTVV